MMKCSNCGNENRDGAKFCSKCRAPLAAVTPGVPSVPPPAAQGPVDQVTPAAPLPQAPSAPAAQPLPGEPDMAKLLALLPDLDIKTTDLQIPLPDVDVSAEIERLTQFNLDEQVRLIQQLEQQLKAGQSGQSQA